MCSKSRIAAGTTVALSLHSGLSRPVTRELSIFRPRIFLCGDSLSLEQTRRRDQWPDMERRQVSQFRAAMRRKKRGTLRSGKGGKGGIVKSRKQAIAIGLPEARKRGAKIGRASCR